MNKGVKQRWLAALAVLAGALWLGFATTGSAFPLFKMGSKKHDIPVVQVLLDSGLPQVDLGARRGFMIEANDGQRCRIKAAGIVVAVERMGLTVKDTVGRVYISERRGLRLEPYKEKTVWCRGREYRGNVALYWSTDGILVINEVDMEGYLKGVVPREMGVLERDGYEALKAQAVAARTYAFFRLRQEQSGYLVADVMDQVYGGTAAEYELSDRAVEATRGEVLRYNGAPVKAYYFSTCGGRTAGMQEVWDVPNPGCFQSIADTLCRISRNYEWREAWSRRDLEKVLARNLPGWTPDTADGERTLNRIEVTARSRSGRVDTLMVVLDSTEFPVCRNAIRTVLRRPPEGRAMLRSTLFELETLRDSTGAIDSVRAIGGGNGHGVGMCQWGAIARANRKDDYRAILRFYYPGTEIMKEY